MSIAGHVSRAMLSRYSHVRMEAKRKALDEIAAQQRTAEERRKDQADAKRRKSRRQPWFISGPCELGVRRHFDPASFTSGLCIPRPACQGQAPPAGLVEV